MVQPYKHEPLTNFSVEENEQAFQTAIKDVEKDLGKKYPLIINGEKVFTEEVIISVNPANKQELLGRVQSK